MQLPNGRQIRVSPVGSPAASPQEVPPSMNQNELTAAVRARWTPEKLEQLIIDKIYERTEASQGQVLPAIRLFTGARSEVTLFIAVY